MPRKNADRSKKALWIGVVCAIVVAATAAITFWLKQGPAPQPEAVSPEPPQKGVVQKGPEKSAEAIPQRLSEQPAKPGTIPMAEKKTAPGLDALPSKAPLSVQPMPVVDYGKIKEDKNLQALMEKRKEKYGFERGVDLIIKPEESLKVGDEVIPMQEILESIRLESGEVIEKDISDTADLKTTPKREDKIVTELDAAEKRYKELDKSLTDTEKVLDKETRERYLREHTELEKIVSVYETYKETTKKIEEKQKFLDTLTAQTTPRVSGETLSKKQALPHPSSEKTLNEPRQDKPLSRAGRVKEPERAEPVASAKTRTALKEAVDDKVDTRTEKPIPGKTIKEKEPESIEKQIPYKTGPVKLPPIAHKPPLEVESGKEVQATVRSDKNLAAVKSMTEMIRQEINTLLLQKSDLANELKMLLRKEKKPEVYGIYVVQKKDNIWNIHFKFLKEYFGHKGIRLSRIADEPDHKGLSSGVGKILKFSENMVYIYNTRERRLATNIDLIHPMGKVVIFNMGQVFQLLESINHKDIPNIQYDGENLWLPAER